MTNAYMNTYKNYLLAAKKSTNTINSYIRAINGCIEYIGKDVENITYMDLLDWQASISGKATATIALNIAAVKSFFAFLVKTEVNTKNPAKGLDAPVVRSKEKRYMNTEMVRKMIDAASNLRDKAIMLTIACTGLRISELTAITIAEYNYAHKSRELVINGKGSKQRTIFLNDEVVDAIDTYLDNRSVDSDYLFCTCSGGKVNEQNITKAIKGYAIKARIPFAEEISAHSLRAAFATILSDNGVPVAVISAALGHSSLGVTTRYVRSNQNNVNAAMATMKI